MKANLKFLFAVIYYELSKGLKDFVKKCININI